MRPLFRAPGEIGTNLGLDPVASHVWQSLADTGLQHPHKGYVSLSRSGFAP